MGTILCTACHKEIKTREELAVVGRSFKPYHRTCFKRAKGIYEFYSGYPVNSAATWIILAVINGAIWGVYAKYDAPFGEALTISLFSVVLFVVFRLIAYFGYEVKLPKKRRTG